MVTVGGPDHDDDAGIESLVRTHYGRLVAAASVLTGRRDAAEELALKALVKLWRRFRWEQAVRDFLGARRNLAWDQQRTWGYLERALVSLGRPAGRRRAIELRSAVRGTLGKRGPGRTDPGRTDPERADPARPGPGAGARSGFGGDERPAGEPGEAAGVAVDAAAAWDELAQRMARASRNRWVALAAFAVAAVAVAAISYSALTGGEPGGQGRTRAPGTSLPAAGNATVRAYPAAVVARIPLSGVVSVAGDRTQAWVIRTSGSTRAGPTYQLAGIDLRTDAVIRRMNLGLTRAGLAVGDGLVWLTTRYAGARGQIVGIDPGTGRVVRTVDVRASGCTSIGFSAGTLIANCQVTATASDFVRIDPATGRVIWRQGTDPATGVTGPIAVTPHSVWYIADFVRVRALVDTAGSVRAATVDDPTYSGSNAATQSIIYGGGSIWVLGNNDSVARVDPVTGTITRIYSPHTFEPLGSGWLNHLAVGDGSLWFLGDGYPFSGVMRVSTANGRPLGRVGLAANSCGQQPCSQIYFASGAIWVPTGQQLIRIDPARLPAGGR